MPKSRQRSKQVPATESFLFRIDSIAPDYAFGVNHTRSEPGGYSEHRHTEVVATCLAPKKQAGKSTTFVLIGDRKITADLENPTDWDRLPNGVGTLTMRGQRNEYLGVMPFDGLAGVAGLIVAGGLKYIFMAGPPLHHGSTRIRYLSFKADFDPDDI